MSDLTTMSIKATISQEIKAIIKDNTYGNTSKKDELKEDDKGAVAIQFKRRRLGRK